MLALSYFPQIVLESALGLVSGDEVHRIISQGSYCTRSEKYQDIKMGSP